MPRDEQDGAIDFSKRFGLKENRVVFTSVQGTPLPTSHGFTGSLLNCMVKNSLGFITTPAQAELIVTLFLLLILGASAFVSWSASRIPSPPPAHEVIWIAGPDAQPGVRLPSL